MQEVLQQSVEFVHQLVQQLGAGDVHAVKDGELLIAEVVIGGGADLQHLSVCVLIHNLPDLPQQSVQMLNENKNS